MLPAPATSVATRASSATATTTARARRTTPGSPPADRYTGFARTRVCLERGHGGRQAKSGAMQGRRECRRARISVRPRTRQRAALQPPGALLRVPDRPVVLEPQFGPKPPLTLGVEEEIMILDAHTLDQTAAVDRIVRGVEGL